MLLGIGISRAEVLTFDSAEKWQTWQIPQGLTEFTDEGQLRLTRFRKETDPVRDATLFAHRTLKRDEVQGGIWRVESNPATALRIIDGDRKTFWRPDAADPLAKWEIEVDLGRAVLAKEIRLTFPDQEGGRPFRQFSVYVSTGALISTADDIFKFDVVYQTTLPNQETEIIIDLGGRRDTTRVLDAGLEVDLTTESRFRTVQYIRIGADEKSEEAALAEVEVLAVGDNISLGVLDRGGAFQAGLVTRDPQFMVDGDMNTHVNKFTVYRAITGWRNEGLWWELDLGAQFWIDELFIYYNEPGEGPGGSSVRNAGTGFSFLFSDGQRTTSGDVDYTPLVSEGDEKEPFSIQDYRYRYFFEPRKMRFLFWHGFLTSSEWHARVPEMMLFAAGFPAQVILQSDFIDLGQIAGDGRPKAIESLGWDANLPPDTRLQLRSRSGMSLSEEYTFFDKKGEEVTETEWNSLPKVVRGEVDTAIVTGEDWSAWSNFYQFSGEEFKSESPRRFIQLELILSTEDPQVTPALRSLSIWFEDALVQEAKGQVLPRQVAPNEDTRFIYTLWLRSTAADAGFDILRFVIPGGLVDVDDIAVQIGDEVVIPSGVSLQEDSLFIALPQQVKRDSLKMAFTARLLRNATVFAAHLGHSERPGLWQSVEAKKRQDHIVFLPELPGSRRLIGDLEISSPVLTPNGDGVNEMV